MNLYPLPKLPATRNGVAYTYKPKDVIHAVGTCTAWGGIDSEVTLQPGRYSLAGSVGTDRQNLYVQITVDADIMPVLTAISDGTSETDG